MIELSIRSSSVPRIIACPASIDIGGDHGIAVDQSLDITRIGLCIHDMAAEMIDKGAPSMPHAGPYLKTWNVEKHSDDIDFLSIQVHRLWFGFQEVPGLSKYFDHPITEIQRSRTINVKTPAGEQARVTLSGHLDVSTYDTPREGQAIVLDWKAGYKTDAGLYIDQMKSYAFLQAAESPNVKRVIAIIGWLRDSMFDVFVFTRAEIKQWAKKLFTEDVWWDGKTYRPGQACQYCPRQYSCPGRTRQIASLAEAFGPGGDAKRQIMQMARGDSLPAEIFHVAVERAKFVKEAAGQLLALAKRSCIEAGPFPIPVSPARRGASRPSRARQRLTWTQVGRRSPPSSRRRSWAPSSRSARAPLRRPSERRRRVGRRAL